MKQTNNAIKFLMAQYRAIFRNANLKMFLAAATAAAALSATQAQAQPVTDWAKVDTVTAGNTLTVSGSGSVAPNEKEFQITLDQAGNEIKTTDNSGAATFTASKGSITLNGASAALTIGSASASGATVDIKKFTNAQGTLTIQGSGATTSILKAGEIVLGTAPDAPAAAKAAPKAIVELKDKGIIGDAKKTTSLSIFDGGELKFAGAGAKAAASGEGVLLNGGKINVLTAATDAAINGKLTVSKGTVDIANSGGLTVDGLTTLTDGTVTVSGGANGGTLNLKGGLTQTKGTIDVKTDATKAGALNISGTTSVTGGEFKVGSGSTVKLEGDASFAKGTLNLDANGKLDLGKLTGDAKRTLTANSNDLKGALATNDSIEASGDATSTFVVELNDTESVDLAAVKLVQDAGTRGAGLKIQTAKYGLKGDKASYQKAAFNDTTAYDFNTLEVGASNAFEIKGGAKVTVHNAISDAKGADLKTLKVSSGDLILSAAEGASGSVGAETLNLEHASDKANATLTLNSGKWTVKNLTLTKGTANVSGGELSVAGTLNTKADSVLEVTGGTVSTLGEGKIKFESNANSVKLGAGTYLKLDADDIFETGKKTLDKNVFKSGSVSGDGSSVIVISGGEALTKTEFQQLLTDTGFKGVFDMNVNLEVPEGDLTIQDIQPNLQTDAYNAKTLKVESTEKIQSALSVGNVKVNAESDLAIDKGGSLILNTADKTTGNFVSKKSGEAIVVGGVKFEDAKNSLTLKGTGNIGAITGTSPNFGTVVVGGDKVEGVVTVVSGNSLGETTNTLNQVSVNDGASLKVESGSVFANNITLEAGSSVTVNGDITSQSAQVDGVLNATGTLSLSAAKDHNFHSAEVNVGKLSLGQNVKLNIGQFDASVEENNHTATVYAGTLELKQGTVFIDPSYVKPHSSLVVGNLSGGTAGSAGSLDGKVVVAQNAALAVGFDSKAEFLDVISKYTQANGAFYETPEANTQQISNALVLNKPISLTATDGILVDAKASGNSTVTNNSVNIKDGAGLVITDEVYTVDPSTGAKSGNAITLATSGTADVSNSKLILIGDFSAADTNLGIFSGATLTGADTMMIQSANGLLQGTMAANGTVGITFDKAAAMKKGAFSDASYPVQQLLFAKLSGELKGNGLGFDLISDVATTAMSGAVADAAAHAATYAGAQQAAVAAVGSMAEAVGGRVGSMGVEAATISATGSQANGGVWLSPMYKSVDADGFNAEGASYGAEVDLAGVAFGTDTVNGNMRFGAVFNIGSGDADGKGNGNGLKDEFDYYGFGMYSVMGFGNFALVGDASLNVISHEVEGLGLKGSADTTAVTMGVTGQYTISNPAVDVTPHVGARFIRLDTDSYDLKSDDGVVASTDFDVQNVFSVPLGVTLSKAFEMGGWSLAPSADLSITFNTGDTEVNSTTQFTGVKAIGLTTEVLDEVTYGVAVGLGAQYGAFGTQIGINYTGSSNTDAFGVNANARYMF